MAATGAIAMAAIVDTSTLGKVILYSLVAGVGIAAIFGLGVSSAAAALESLRLHRTRTATAWGLVAVGCLAASLGAAVLGVVVMLSKS
jgi:hypothetical protein